MSAATTCQYCETEPCSCEPSPLPWHIGTDGKLHYQIDPGDGLCSPVPCDWPPNARLIECAVNGHGELQAENAALVAALREMLAAYRGAMKHLGWEEMSEPEKHANAVLATRAAHAARTVTPMMLCEVCRAPATHLCSGLDVPAIRLCALHAPGHGTFCPHVIAGQAQVVRMGDRPAHAARTEREGPR